MSNVTTQQNISKENFIGIFDNLKGFQFISLEIEKVPDVFKKKSVFYGRAVKQTSKGVYLVGPDAYRRLMKNKLNKSLEGSGDEFKPQSLAWGEHVNGQVISHKGELYLQVFPIKTSTVYTLEGETFNPYSKEYATEVLSGYKPKDPSKDTGKVSVKVNAIKFTNIRCIKFNKVSYKIDM